MEIIISGSANDFAVYYSEKKIACQKSKTSTMLRVHLNQVLPCYII